MSGSIKRGGTWYERSLDALECVSRTNDWAAPDVELEKTPQWVRRVLLEMIQQVWPAVPVKGAGAITPRLVGLALGQQCANLYAIGALQVTREQVKASEEYSKRLEANRGLPGVESVLKVKEMLRELFVNLPKDWPALFKRGFTMRSRKPWHSRATKKRWRSSKGLKREYRGQG